MSPVVSKWLMQRVAAIILLPFLIWFLFNFDNLMTYSYIDAITFLKKKYNAIILGLLFVLAFFHMKIGMGEIFEDYIHDEKIKKAATFLTLLISFVIPIAAILLMIILVL